jgi:DNA mismatch endonuclease (patch repair protein)
MADVFDKEKRSFVMRQVKSSRNKSTELKLISFFRANNIIGWRRNFPLFGKPDFVFSKKKTVVFVDGCFWHGHNCRNTKPSSNREYWQNKVKRNKKRDKIVNATLKKKGWKIIRLWECRLADKAALQKHFSNLK